METSPTAKSTNAEKEPTVRPSTVGASNQDSIDSVASNLPISFVAPLAIPSPKEDRAPFALPGYGILELLGRGGMGAVYLARQERPNRLVAIKTIAATGQDNPEILKRFRRESELLGQLRHPNIVPVYEVGEKEGRAYFSMEYLTGGSLDKRLAGMPQTVAVSAAAIEILARAMHATHSAGVVHRDLKPANVLLSTDEAVPPGQLNLENCSLKITDFGLAKQGNAGSGATHSGVLLGTPSYMAPEQASGKASTAGPAADIYSLGAILYEMLTGRPPFRGESAWETVSQVMDQDPVPPTQLQPRLPRDVEAICLKCLQKSPSRRYHTAEALADDLRRLLEGKTVLAQPTSSIEKLWKWTKRNRSLAASLLLAVMLLIAGTVISSWQAIRARNAEIGERNRADKEKRAREGTAKALEFITGVLIQASPNSLAEAGLPIRRDVTVQEAMKEATKLLDGKYEDQPLIEANLRNIIGSINLSLGEFRESRQHLQRAVELFRAHAGIDHLDTLHAMNDLANCLMEMGDQVAAETIHRQVMQGKRDLLGEDDLDTLQTMHNLGWLYKEAGRYKQASELLTQSFKGRQRQLGDRDRLTLSTANCLAAVNEYEGNLERAEKMYLKTLQGCRESLGDKDPYTLSAFENIGLFYLQLGNYAQAEPHLKSSFKGRLITGNPKEIFMTAISLAKIYINIGPRPEAEQVLKDALEAVNDRNSKKPDSLKRSIQEAVALIAKEMEGKFPGQPLREADFQVELASICDALGAFAEAKKYASKSVHIFQLNEADRSIRSFRAQNILGITCHHLRQFDEAASHLRQVVSGFQSLFGENGHETLIAMHNLAGCYMEAENLKEAETLYSKALQGMKKINGVDHPATLTVMDDLGWLYKVKGELDKAEELLQEVLATRRKVLGGSHPAILRTVNKIASVFELQGKHLLAEKLYKENLESCRKTFGNSAAETLTALSNLALFYMNQNQFSPAEPLLAEAVAGYSSSLPKESPQLTQTQVLLLQAQIQLRKYAEAEIVGRKVLAVRQQNQPDLFTTFNTESVLGEALFGQGKFAEAEPRILSGYQGIKAREKQIPPQGRARLTEAAERVVRFYQAWGKPDLAAEWKSKVAADIVPMTMPPPK